MRGYIFTDYERRRLRRWLETGEEDHQTRKIFVNVRKNLDRITGDVELLTEVARGLRARGRLAGRARLPPGFGSTSRPAGSESTPRGRGRVTSGASRG